MYDLQDKVVLITGAATGIGAKVVPLLLDEHVKHVAVLDVKDDTGVAFENELNGKYGANKVKFYKCDVTDEDVLFAVFKAVTDEQGYIDIVINNAGLLNDSREVYKKMIQVNYTALVTSTLHAMDLMRKDRGGKGGAIINISSVGALIQTTIRPIYCGLKSAVLQFSNCMGLPEYHSATGVRVVTICFGATTTPLIVLENMGSYDAQIEDSSSSALRQRRVPRQKAESAARGVVAVCKQGESGTTWIVNVDKPAKDITDTVKKAYAMLSELVHDEY